MKKKIINCCLALTMVFAGTSLFAAETMGQYLNRPSDKDNSTFLDTMAWTYTQPNYLIVQVTFADKDIQKRDKDGAGTHQFFLELNRAEYEKIFEANTALVDMPVNDQMWDRKVSTEVTPAGRVVKVAFTNAIDKEITEVFSRGTLELQMKKDEIVSMKMFKEKKRFLNMGGYKTAFIGEATSLKRAIKGLALLDNGEMGRLAEVEKIDKALAVKTGKNFSELIKARK